MSALTEFLVLPPSADAVIIKRAYRAACKRLHPDHGGDAEQFKILNSLWVQCGGKCECRGMKQPVRKTRANPNDFTF